MNQAVVRRVGEWGGGGDMGGKELLDSDVGGAEV